MRVRLIGVLLCLGLAACQMSLPFRKAEAPAAATGVTAAPGAIMGGPITATAIKPGPAVAAGDTPPPPAPVAEPAPTPVVAAAPDQAATTPADPAAPEATPATVAPAAPAAPKSAAQLACERKKGVWSSAGKQARVCVFRTRDGGEACRAETDCDGLCLARSGTCAPLKPLFGCNDILDSMGRRVTLCID